MRPKLDPVRRIQQRLLPLGIGRILHRQAGLTLWIRLLAICVYMRDFAGCGLDMQDCQDETRLWRPSGIEAVLRISMKPSLRLFQWIAHDVSIARFTALQQGV